MVVLVLLLLAVLLIYSLLMVNVEERTFQFGVMRMVTKSHLHNGIISIHLLNGFQLFHPWPLVGSQVGERKLGIVHLLLVEAFSYSLPAWLLGMPVAQGLIFILAHYFNQITGTLK